VLQHSGPSRLDSFVAVLQDIQARGGVYSLQQSIKWDVFTNRRKQIGLSSFEIEQVVPGRDPNDRTAPAFPETSGFESGCQRQLTLRLMVRRLEFRRRNVADRLE
jgi:hypothetical protein